MTRGKIVLIQSDMQVYITCEFNGDMHPNMHGEEILKCFKNGLFQNYRGYERFVEKLNSKYFGYDELIKESNECANRTIDITNSGTDYLYIINESSVEWNIKTKENEEKLLPHSLAVIHYQTINNIEGRKNEETLKNTRILSEQEFVDVMNRLREASDLQEQVDKLFRNSRENIENDFCNAAALQISHENTVVFLLKRIMRDQYDYIDYFIYELDYGRKYEVGMMTDENGQNIDIHTPGLLYDFISNNGVIYQKGV